jgi:23S rRNA pseudouridine1911/1915/1917 synthase
VLRIIASEQAKGQRLDQFLVTLADVPLLSRSHWQKLIDEKHVLVNNKVVRASHRLLGGETLSMDLPAPQPMLLTPEPRSLDILFEDKHLLAINKPAGLVVHPGAGQQTGTLVHALLAHCQDLSGIGGVLRPGIVHRLDRDTSGVMVVAKHDQAHESLARQFAQREVTKIYTAFVYGTPKPAHAVIETLYGRHPKQRKRFSGRVLRGKRAVTAYDVIISAGGISELSILLGTGRTHQIRVHMSEAGHPLVGDKLYGKSRRLLKGAIAEVVTGIHRQALHAARLDISHPITAARMSFVAPLAADLAILANSIRHAHSPF